jgi:hypothetical protein
MTHTLDERLDKIEALLREILDVLQHPVPTSAPLDLVALTSLTVPQIRVQIMNDAREMVTVELSPTIVQTRRNPDGGGVVSVRWTRKREKYDPLGFPEQRILEILYTWRYNGELMEPLEYRKNPQHNMVPPPPDVVGNVSRSGPSLVELLNWISWMRD